MKRLFTAVVFAAVAVAGVQAQFNIRVSLGGTAARDTVDTKVMTVQYDMEFVTDPGNADSTVKETMRLDIGRKVSRFYSYTRYLCDSIMEADLRAGVSQEVMTQHASRYRSQWSEQTFKNLPEGCVTTTDQIAGEVSRLKCEEAMDMPQWTLLADTVTVAGYLCRSAECFFKGRKWKAWYAHEIPVSEGPWKLHGLPGLVLKAEDGANHYRFIANGLEQCRTGEPVLFDGRDYEPVNRKQYDKIHRRYYSDPVGYIAGVMPNVKIQINDEHGNAAPSPKDLPYNPIELGD